MLKSVRKAIASVSAIMLSISGINFGAMKNVGVMAKSEDVAETTTIVWGDTNCNGSVEMADAVFILQSVANPDKYGVGKEEGITNEGAINADVYRNGDGITPADALSIQKFKLELITELPESYAEDKTTTTTSTTNTSTTTTTTTSKPDTTTTTSTTTTMSTVSYYYEKYTRDDGTTYFRSEHGTLLGPDSNEKTYNRLITAAQKFGFENYKIVYSEVIIPYAYVIPHREMEVCYAWQIAPIDDLVYICPELYDILLEEGEIEVCEYVMWRPAEAADTYFDCGNDIYTVYKDEYIRSTILAYWQLIPTDAEGNDILKLASDSPVLQNSLYSG